LGTSNRSVEQFLAETLSNEAGGSEVTVEQLQTTVGDSPTLLIFDGLDEVGSDDLRDLVVSKIIECINRLEKDLNWTCPHF
jgi:predicted NACHT family NTPase